MISVFASEEHFADHLAPTYLALPEAYRGPFVVPPALAARYPFETGPWKIPTGPTLVASYGDLSSLPRRTPVAFSEHGAGQTYVRKHPSYAGGRGRNRVGLFLCQSHRVAAINERAWPGRRYAVVGVPRLDDLHRQGGRRLPAYSNTVVVSFHWDSTVQPETRWAWPAYRDALPHVLTDAGWNVVGHSHPRSAEFLSRWWAARDVGFVPDFDDVLTIADAYVVDNSSTLYEAASVGLPVVAMNAPWYRRDVSHGLRFWDRIPGPTVDRPDDLPAALDAARTDEWAVRREQTIGRVFARRDGTAAEAAATAIVGWADDGFPIVSDPERYDAMADRPHDPFAPRRKAGGTTRARVGATVEARKVPAETDPTVSSLPADADEVVDYLDTAETDDDRHARALAALDAEADRTPSRRRISVVAALSEILGEETVDARLDTADNPTPQNASGSPETAADDGGSGDTPEAENAPEGAEGDDAEAENDPRPDLDESGGMHGADTPVADGEAEDDEDA